MAKVIEAISEEVLAKLVAGSMEALAAQDYGCAKTDGACSGDSVDGFCPESDGGCSGDCNP